MALLPPVAGKQHAPSALRHLMDADSPVSELYDVCAECASLLDETKTANLRLAKVRPVAVLLYDINIQIHQKSSFQWTPGAAAEQGHLWQVTDLLANTWDHAERAHHPDMGDGQYTFCSCAGCEGASGFEAGRPEEDCGVPRRCHRRVGAESPAAQEYSEVSGAAIPVLPTRTAHHALVYNVICLCTAHCHCSSLEAQDTIINPS